MKDQSTEDSFGRPVSECGKIWDVQRPNYRLRFERIGCLLKVEALTMRQFQYYFGAFVVEEVKGQGKEYKQYKRVPRIVADSLDKMYIEIEFEKGEIVIWLPQEYSRFKQKTKLRLVNKLQLNQYLFTEIKRAKDQSLEIWSLKRLLEQTKIEKETIFKELKSKHRQHFHLYKEPQENQLKESLIHYLADTAKTLQQVAKKLPGQIIHHCQALTAVIMVGILLCLLLFNL